MARTSCASCGYTHTAVSAAPENVEKISDITATDLILHSAARHWACLHAPGIPPSPTAYLLGEVARLAESSSGADAPSPTKYVLAEAPSLRKCLFGEVARHAERSSRADAPSPTKYLIGEVARSAEISSGGDASSPTTSLLGEVARPAESSAGADAERRSGLSPQSICPGKWHVRQSVVRG